jgi:DNA-binding CsgD family transcriptional regulator
MPGSLSDKKMLKLLKRGFTSTEIAKELGMSIRSIAYKRQEMMIKNKAKSAFHLGYLLGRRS